MPDRASTRATAGTRPSSVPSFLTWSPRPRATPTCSAWSPSRLRSKGRVMPINPEAVGATSEPADRSWDSKDALLYAVGVGCGIPDPLDELQFTTENTQNMQQQVLPTFAVIAGMAGGGAMGRIGSFNPAMLVHGEQAITLHKPIPVAGTVTCVGKVVGIWDKGSAAVVE